jgi:hypothetical protein
VWCSLSKPGSGVAIGTHGCNRWHDASLTRYGRSWQDTGDRYGLRCVKWYGSVVDQGCLPTKVA